MSISPTVLLLPVRYSETDAMKFVYYANYLVYFEVARTHALSLFGFPYWGMEKNGVFIPVLESHCSYRKPARYGDTLRIETSRWRLGLARIRFDYSISREGESASDLLTTGWTTHAFMNPEGKPLRPPREMMDLFPEWPGGKA